MTNEGKKVYVLFGFDQTKFITDCKSILNAFGYELECVQKYSKQSIEEFLKSHPEYQTAVIKESMGKTKYTADEIAHLCDSRDINVIPVLGEVHRGTPYMQTLYNAGITSALFSTADKGSDATAEHVVKLILQKRTREKAREYYKISTGNMGIDVFTPQQEQDAIAAIMDTSWGNNVGDRFLKLCGNIKTRQAFQLIQALPPDLRSELEKYDEFYTILLRLKEKGVAINKKSWVAGMEAVLKKKKLEGKRKPALEVREDNEYIIRQKQQEIKRAELREEYIQKGGTYDVPPVPEEDDYVGKDDLNVSGASSYIEPAVEPQMGGYPNGYGAGYASPQQMYTPNQPPYQQMPQNSQSMSQNNNMPPMTDWKAMKKWQKEQAKLQKVEEKNRKRAQRMALNNPPMKAEKPSKPSKSKRIANDTEGEMKPFFKRMIISLVILGIIAAIITIVLASAKVSQQQAVNENLRTEVLTEQMNDLAELRGDMNAIDVSMVTPRISTVVNGQSIMGLEVMDTINSSDEMFYVISLSGEVFTFENGGATSTEVDLNSMYRCQLLSSGRFAFVQL